MSSTKKKARTAGTLYLFLSLTAIFGVLYVPSTLVVGGDPAATAENIRSSELLFRAGIFSSLVSNVLFLFLALALYRLLSGIHRERAVLMVVLVAISAAVGFLHVLFELAALIAVKGADVLSAFTQSQLDALGYFFLRFHGQGFEAMQIFWGLWLFPFASLVYRSRFIPKIFAILLVLAGCSYLLSSTSFFLLPRYRSALEPFFMVFRLGELSIIFWLLIVGARKPPAGGAAAAD